MTRQARSLENTRFARFVLAIFAACTCVSPAHAGLTWNWSFDEIEAGTFVTNGTLADAAVSFDFTITDFTVTASTVTSLVGRPYTEDQPLQGFLWDGSTATQFYRNNGGYTNGSNFNVSEIGPSLYRYSFFAPPSQGGLFDSNDDPVVTFSVLTMSPSGPSGVPEIDPVTGTSAVSLVAGVLAMIEQRRRRTSLLA